jgi:hypothetical protein
MDNARDVPSAGKYALMSPFESGGKVKKNRWGDKESEKVFTYGSKF